MKIRRNPGARRVPRRLGLGHRTEEPKRGAPTADTDASSGSDAGDLSSGDRS